MNERQQRKGKHAIDADFEGILKKINDALLNVESESLPDVDEVTLPPLIFFCSAPRTGSTMMAQYLARTGEFSYVSNYTARFWEAPYLAMLLERKLGFRAAFLDCVRKEEVESGYGITKHLSDPHEFGFFWNKLLTSQEHHGIDESALSPVLVNQFIRQVNAMRSVFPLPFFFKNGIAGYNTGWLNQCFPKAKFIVVQRDPVYVAQSIYVARKELYEDEKRWVSLKPKGIQSIFSEAQGPEEEIALQIKHIYQDIFEGLAGAPERTMQINYTEFCANPLEATQRIFDFIGCTPSTDLSSLLPVKIEEKRSVNVSPAIFDALKSEVERHIPKGHLE